LAQLPASVRGELPQLTVGGSMYSDEPAARLVILNGQPYRERDVVAPGLTLELIQPRAAILEYRGYRIKLKL
jgi:general secretion pathway protein B